MLKLTHFLENAFWGSGSGSTLRKNCWIHSLWDNVILVPISVLTIFIQCTEKSYYLKSNISNFTNRDNTRTISVDFVLHGTISQIQDVAFASASSSVKTDCELQRGHNVVLPLMLFGAYFCSYIPLKILECPALRKSRKYYQFFYFRLFDSHCCGFEGKQ